MTASEPAPVGGPLGTIVRSPLALWIAFVVAHLWLGFANLYAPGWPLGDVTHTYALWMQEGLVGGIWVGIDVAWVYPIVALVPMLVSTLLGPALYGAAWLLMVTLLNLCALGVLTGWGRSRRHTAIGWWWLAFLLLLGPIALGRLDSVTVPVALIGVLLLARRPALAGVILAIATWIKVWPAALILAALLALRERWRMLAGVLVTSAVVLLVAVLLGSGSDVFSFITQQTGRGIQVESPVATFWLWQALVGAPGARVYYDHAILTYQVLGSGVDAAAAVMTPLLAVAVLVIAALGLRAQRAGAHPGDLFPSLALALVTAFIAINKVGSPQFIAWLAVPVVLGLVASRSENGPSFRVPATLALVIAALTQLFYPYLYLQLLDLNPLLLAALTVRNVLEFVLLGWAVSAVVRSPGRAAAQFDADAESRWPLGAGRESVDGSPAVRK